MRICTKFRLADFRLHVATSAQRNLSTAQIRVDTERLPARSAERHRRSDGGPVGRTLVNNGRPLGESPQPGADGRALEPGYTGLRPCAKLPAHASRQILGRHRRGGLCQRRRRSGAFGVPQAAACDPHQYLHGWRHVWLSTGHGARWRHRPASGLAHRFYHHGDFWHDARHPISTGSQGVAPWQLR
ncbi:hypothetical protein D3C84_677960 [compost metagenome]